MWSRVLRGFIRWWQKIWKKQQLAIADAPKEFAAKPISGTQQKRGLCSRSGGLAEASFPADEEESWTAFNELSCSTRASLDVESSWARSSTRLSLDHFDSDRSLSPEASSPEALDSVDVCMARLCFYDGLTDEAGDRRVVTVQRIEFARNSRRAVQAVGRRLSLAPCDSVTASTFPDELLVDVRIDAEDELCLVRLASVRSGDVSLRVDWEAGPPAIEVGGGDSWMRLEDAVAELQAVQVRRHNAKLQAYQKQLNARLMGSQRRRALGIA